MTKAKLLYKIQIMSQIEKFLAKNPHWGETKKVIHKLCAKGFEAVLVGGGVRDALLGLPPKDLDIATSATPREVVTLFPQCKRYLLKYGTCFLPLKQVKKHMEVTTFRTDQAYKDGRRPESVRYASIQEDAQRRDFTINGLFYHVQKKKLIDFVEGQKDLKKKRIKAIGDPYKRLEEDHLRVLRALRLAHSLNFSLEKETSKALKLLAPKVKKLSRERVFEELTKMLLAGSLGEGLKLLKDYKLLHVALKLPSVSLQNPWVFWNKDLAFCQTPSSLWAIIGLPYFKNAKTFKKFLQQFNMPTTLVKKNLNLFQSVQTLTSQQASLGDQFQAFASDPLKMEKLVLLWAKSSKQPQQKLKSTLNKFHKLIKQKGKKLKPLITSQDLLKQGYKPSKKLGDLLKQALEWQIKYPQKTKREILKALKNI